MKSVVYQGVRLMPGSESLRLWEEWQKRPSFSGTKQKPAGKILLDAHMAELDRVWRKMEGRA